MECKILNNESIEAYLRSMPVWNSKGKSVEHFFVSLLQYTHLRRGVSLLMSCHSPVAQFLLGLRDIFFFFLLS